MGSWVQLCFKWWQTAWILLVMCFPALGQHCHNAGLLPWEDACQLVEDVKERLRGRCYCTRVTIKRVESRRTKSSHRSLSLWMAPEGCIWIDNKCFNNDIFVKASTSWRVILKFGRKKKSPLILCMKLRLPCETARQVRFQLYKFSHLSCSPSQKILWTVGSLWGHGWEEQETFATSCSEDDNLTLLQQLLQELPCCSCIELRYKTQRYLTKPQRWHVADVICSKKKNSEMLANSNACDSQSKIVHFNITNWLTQTLHQ